MKEVTIFFDGHFGAHMLNGRSHQFKGKFNGDENNIISNLRSLADFSEETADKLAYVYKVNIDLIRWDCENCGWIKSVTVHGKIIDICRMLVYVKNNY